MLLNNIGTIFQWTFWKSARIYKLIIKILENAQFTDKMPAFFNVQELVHIIRGIECLVTIRTSDHVSFVKH